mgnify:CR=1 FL=1
MANTKISLTAYDQQTLTVFLVAKTGATGTPNPAGYSMTEVSTGLYLSDDIPEALTGDFYVYATDADGDLAFTGYVTVQDNTETHDCYESPILVAILRKALLLGAGDATVPIRMYESELTIFIKETHTLTIQTGDYTGKTLRFVFEGKDRSDLAVIDDGDITKTSSSISIAIPPAVTASERNLRWSVRDVANGDEVLLYGTATVTYAPIKN